METHHDGKWDIASQPYMMFGPLVTPHDIATNAAEAGLSAYSPAEVSSLRSLADFMTDVLPHPHDDLGRAGAVCPFSSGSIRRGLMGLTASRLDRVHEEYLATAMDALREVFLSARLLEKDDEIFRSITVVFPHLPLDEGSILIDKVQKALKPSYVKDGLMLGEFYPGCSAPGIHNAMFRPLQTPVVCLSIRHMTVLDAPFMLDDAQHLAAYLDRYGGGGAHRVRNSATTRGCPRTSARVHAVIKSHGPGYEASL